MAIPTHLDTYVLGNMVISPELGIDKKSGSHVIIVRIFDSVKKTMDDIMIFETEIEYNGFISELLKALGK